MPTYLRLDGIKGPATVQGFEGQIEARSFSHTVARPLALATGGTHTQAGPPTLSEITLTKLTDASSVPLLRASLTGKPFAAARISFVRADSGAPFAYLTLDLANAWITSVATSSDRDLPVEQLTLAAERLTWSYDDPRDRDPAVTVGFDLSVGKVV
jgi:type VI secretion system secreted protein Hcp